MYKPNAIYRPWLKNLMTMMIALFSATLLGILSIRFKSLTMGVVAIACVVWAYSNYHSYNVRLYGKRVERRAQKALKRVYKRSQVKVQPNVRCSTGGDIDVVLQYPGARIAVEIKSWAGLKKSRRGLVKLNGASLKKDPAEQARRQAQSIGGHALIWMPAAKRRKPFVYHDVLIVMGDVGYLRKLLKKTVGR